MDCFKKEFTKIKERLNTGLHMRKFSKIKRYLSERPLIIYGTGAVGSSTAKLLISQNIKIECFCDSFKVGYDAKYHLPIISPKMLKENYLKANVIISSDTYYYEILSILQELGFANEQLSVDFSFFSNYVEDYEKYIDGYEWIYNIVKDDISKRIILNRLEQLSLPFTLPFFSSVKSSSAQYFENKLIRLSGAEIFVDGGMYIGDTAEEFLRQTGGKYKHYYGFEPDICNCKKARTNLSQYDNMDIITKGLWNEETELNFIAESSGSSSISSAGSAVIKVISLDKFFSDKSSVEYPTLIKLDVEGAEQEAIQGAESLIRYTVPKIAACVYHKPEDIYKIPQILNKFNSGYEFTLRHYSTHVNETVLYALEPIYR